MTREEKQKAIDALKISAPVMAVTQEEFTNYIQTINQVMDWLEQEPTTKNCRTCKNFGSHHGICEICKDNKCWTEQAPRKVHWEHGRELSRVFIGDALKGINYEDWHCSNCHCVIEQSIKPKWNYCPNCGADMRGEE